jgi:fatty-acyl-CoA synthase
MLSGSYRSGPAATPLTGETIGQRLARTIADHPQDEALVSVHQGARLTWAQLGERVTAVASGLLALGIEKGDRVGVWSPTCVEWTSLQLAAARVGAILVNVNPGYRAAELRYALGHSGARVLVTASIFKGSDFVSMIDSVRPELPALERVVTIGGSPAGGPLDLTWAELEARGSAADPLGLELREATLEPDDAINIQYTSGTTGNPKGATLSHHSILNNAVSVAELLGYTAADRVCIPVPLYHCFGMGIGNLGCVASGATMVYPAASFDPVCTLMAVAEERCTSLYGVPTMFIAELDHPRFGEFEFTSLRTGIMGGSPCPTEVMRRVVRDMHAEEICIAYGMTETAPLSFATRRVDSLDRRVATVGTVLPHVEAKIVDPLTGLTVRPGTAGEVCSRGYLVMRGYWDDPLATAEAIDADGWMHTGDLGVMDDGGYLNIVGRIKDMVIRGGENLFPKEIEDVLFEHPDVASAQVIGVPDPVAGEELMAWIIPREGTAPDSEAIRAFCGNRIAHFKVPRYVAFVDEFPMTVTGKVQKFALRQRAIEELGLQQAATVATA